MKYKNALFVVAGVAWIFLLIVMAMVSNGVTAYARIPEYHFVLTGGVIMGVLLTIAYDTCIYIFLRLTDRKRVHERAKDH